LKFEIWSLKFEVWNLKFESCNRLLLVCNRLPVIELQKFKLKSHESSLHNCIIDYQRVIIDYQWGNFKSYSEKSHPFISFWKTTKGLKICDLSTKVFKRFFHNLIVLSSQKQIISQTLANQLRIFLRTSPCIFFSKREKNICTFFKDLLKSRGCLSLEL